MTAIGQVPASGNLDCVWIFDWIRVQSLEYYAGIEVYQARSVRVVHRSGVGIGRLHRTDHILVLLVEDRTAHKVVPIRFEPGLHRSEDAPPIVVEHDALKTVAVHNQVVLLPAVRQTTDVGYTEIDRQAALERNLLRDLNRHRHQIDRVDREAVLCEEACARASTAAILKRHTTMCREDEMPECCFEETARREIVESLLPVDLVPSGFAFRLDAVVASNVLRIVVSQGDTLSCT